MGINGILHHLKTVTPVINACQPRRWKSVDVKDIVKWKFVSKPSKLTPSWSGDLGVNDPIDMTEPQLALRSADDVLKSSDEHTQRVLSLEFARGVEQRQSLENKAIAYLQRHRYDTESPEAKIGALTVKVRHFQQQWQQPESRRLGHLRYNVVCNTDKRSGQLRRLRNTDYRRFEWVLEQMNIVYRPPLPYQADVSLSRKSGIRRMVQIFCDGLRQEKLDALKARFEAETPAFERERRAACEWIAAEEAALGLPSSVDPDKGELLERRLSKRVVVPPRREQSEEQRK